MSARARTAAGLPARRARVRRPDRRHEDGSRRRRRRTRDRRGAGCDRPRRPAGRRGVRDRLHLRAATSARAQGRAARTHRDPRRSRRASTLRRVTQETEGATRILTAAFADRLADAVERKRSQLCVGLDPRVDLLPVELRGESVLGRAAAAAAMARFCTGIIDAVAPYVVAIKPQVAFFEALGADGWRALEDVCAYARKAGLLVIADAKRGDIGSTARAYAAAFLEPNASALPLAD